MRILVRAEVPVAAPAADVFGYVTDWERQEEWIPQTRVEVHPDDRGSAARRVGGRFRAWSGLGPFGFWDTITVTVWEEEPDGSGRCEILHTGSLIRGEAEFRVVAHGPEACRASLWEHLDVPGGPVGALLWRLVGRVVGPLVDRAAEQVLRRMARRAEALRGAGG